MEEERNVEVVQISEVKLGCSHEQSMRSAGGSILNRSATFIDAHELFTMKYPKVN